MDKRKNPARFAIAIGACLLLSTIPGSDRSDTPSGDEQSLGLEATAVKTSRPISSEITLITPSKPGKPQSAKPELADNSAIAATAEPAIDWTRIMFPELTRIAELEHESAVMALAELTPMLDNDDPAVRRAAIEAIGDMTIPAILPIVSLGLRDPNPQVRVAAIEALVAREDRSGATAVEPLIHDSAREVRLAAIDALAELEADSAVHALASLLADQDPLIRHRAVLALGDIGGAGAISYLAQARYDADATIRWDAESILAELEYEAAN